MSVVQDQTKLKKFMTSTDAEIATEVQNAILEGLE